VLHPLWFWEFGKEKGKWGRFLVCFGAQGKGKLWLARGETTVEGGEQPRKEAVGEEERRKWVWLREREVW